MMRIQHGTRFPMVRLSAVQFCCYHLSYIELSLCSLGVLGELVRASLTFEFLFARSPSSCATGRRVEAFSACLSKSLFTLYRILVNWRCTSTRWQLKQKATYSRDKGCGRALTHCLMIFVFKCPSPISGSASSGGMWRMFHLYVVAKICRSVK